MKHTNLDEDFGFHGPASTPEDESEEREEEEEAENESEEIESARASVVMVLRLEKAFFFNDIDILPWLGAVVTVVVMVHLA